MPPTPPKQTLQMPRLWVERIFPLGNTTFEEQHLETRVFATEPAKVRAEASRTINLGNFESLRIAVGVELPCYVEEVAQGMHEASAMVADFMNREEAAVKQSIQARG